MADEAQGIGPDPALAGKSADDVGAMLDSMRTDPAPAPEPEPDPEPAPIEEPPPANGVPPVEAAPPPPPPPDDTPPPLSLEEQLDDLRHGRELDALEREKLNEELRVERLAREQANTSRGALKKVATDLMREGRELPPDATEYEDGERPESREFQGLRQEINRLKEVEVQRAVQDAGGRFASDNPDYAEYVEAMKPHTARLRQEYSSYLDSGDPRLVRETTRLILKTALIDAKAERMKSARAEAQAKRSEQFESLRKSKANASVAAPGGAPPVRPKPKTAQDMTADEAGAALDRML